MRLALLHVLCLIVLLTVSHDANAPDEPAPSPYLPPAGSLFRPGLPIQIAALLPGMRLEVTLLSRGCFNFFEAHLVLRMDRTARTRVTGTAAHVGGRVRTLAPRYLTQQEAPGLDRMLRLFREQPAGGNCTTQTELQLAVYNGRVLLQAEHYRDAWCLDTPDATHFISLVADVLEEPV